MERKSNIKIGYQGVKGSFSEEAMIEFFGENQNEVSYEKFEDVFIALEKDEIEVLKKILNKGMNAIKKR